MKFLGCSDITEDLVTFEQFVLPKADNGSENYMESKLDDGKLQVI